MAWGRGPTIDISPRENVEKLGQLVQAGLERMNLPTLVTRSSSAADLARGAGVGHLVAHRAELPDEDLLVVETVAALAEEHGTGTVEAHGEGDEGDHRRRRQQHDTTDHDVLHALRVGAPVGVRRAVERGQRGLGQLLHDRSAARR